MQNCVEELKTDFKDSGRILGHLTFVFIEAWRPISRQSAAAAGTLSLNPAGCDLLNE